MKEIYHVEGSVNRGFVGQITYMVCLEKPCTKLDIHFSFDEAKRRYKEEDVTSELIEETIRLSRENCGAEIDEKRAREVILGEMKTEIHTLAVLNDEFIGCIHKQLPDRHMIFSPEETSLGCIPQEKMEGVLKITLLVFNVAKDDTHYTLRVRGK